MKIGANLQAYQSERFSDRFGISTKSFIRDIEPQEAKIKIEGMKNDIKENWRLTECGLEEAVLWNKKSSAAWNISDLASELASSVEKNNSDIQFTACFVHDDVIGVMAWGMISDEPGLYIHAIFSHPGVRGAGTALIEHLVNMSDYLGEMGVIKLDVLDAESAHAYRKLGFIQSGSGLDFELIPDSAHGLWKKHDNEWKFWGNKH